MVLCVIYLSKCNFFERQADYPVRTSYTLCSGWTGSGWDVLCCPTEFLAWHIWLLLCLHTASDTVYEQDEMAMSLWQKDIHCNLSISKAFYNSSGPPPSFSTIAWTSVQDQWGINSGLSVILWSHPPATSGEITMHYHKINSNLPFKYTDKISLAKAQPDHQHTKP